MVNERTPKLLPTFDLGTYAQTPLVKAISDNLINSYEVGNGHEFSEVGINQDLETFDNHELEENGIDKVYSLALYINHSLKAYF